MNLIFSNPDCVGLITSELSIRDFKACLCVSRSWKRAFDKNSNWAFFLQSLTNNNPTSNLEAYSQALYFKDWQELKEIAGKQNFCYRIALRILEICQYRPSRCFRHVAKSVEWAANFVFAFRVQKANLPFKCINEIPTIELKDLGYHEDCDKEGGFFRFVHFVVDVQNSRLSAPLMKGLLPRKYGYQVPFIVYKQGENFCFFSGWSLEKPENLALLMRLFANVRRKKENQISNFNIDPELKDTKLYFSSPEKDKLAKLAVKAIAWREFSAFARLICSTLGRAVYWIRR